MSVRATGLRIYFKKVYDPLRHFPPEGGKDVMWAVCGQWEVLPSLITLPAVISMAGIQRLWVGDMPSHKKVAWVTLLFSAGRLDKGRVTFGFSRVTGNVSFATLQS